MRLRNLGCIAAVAVTLSACASTDGSEFPPDPPPGYRSIRILKLAYALGLIELVELEPAVPDTVNEFRQIEYLKIGDTSLKLDIYQPAVHDVQCAIVWIRDHADEYMIDPDRIALIGGSAGGHLAMMAAYSDDEFTSCGDVTGPKVQAVVNLYGPSDLTTDFAIHHPTIEGFLGPTYAAHPELFVQASPVRYISSDDPPTLIFHGTLDETVPVNQSDLLKAKLDQVGVASEYHRLEGWPHTMDAAASVNAYCQYYIAEFLAIHLGE